MVTSLQRLGTLSMFIGSIMYILYLFKIYSLSGIWLQLVTSILAFTVGLILSSGLKLDDRFLKAFGINVYIIGTGYMCKAAFIFEPIVYGYASSLLGGLMMAGGFFLVYFQKGKPTEMTIWFHYFCGKLVIAIGLGEMLINILLRTWTTSGLATESLAKAWINLVIGASYYTIGISLDMSFQKKTERGRVEPDIVFFGNYSIFDQIFY